MVGISDCALIREVSLIQSVLYREVHILCNCPLTCLCSDYKEYHTDTTVKFVVTLSEQRMLEAEREGFHKKFKLEGCVATSNMVGTMGPSCMYMRMFVCSLRYPVLMC